LGPHTGYAAGVLGPLILAAIGTGTVTAPSISTGTFGVAPQDVGVAFATVTVGQQFGASVGTEALGLDLLEVHQLASHGRSPEPGDSRSP
jgi:hypothetical protein